MGIKVGGNPLKSAHVLTDLGHLSCFGHFIRSNADTNRFF